MGTLRSRWEGAEKGACGRTLRALRNVLVLSELATTSAGHSTQEARPMRQIEAPASTSWTNCPQGREPEPARRRETAERSVQRPCSRRPQGPRSAAPCMGTVGVEPTPPCGERILSPPRLPFRHVPEAGASLERHPSATAPTMDSDRRARRLDPPRPIAEGQGGWTFHLRQSRSLKRRSRLRSTSRRLIWLGVTSRLAFARPRGESAHIPTGIATQRPRSRWRLGTWS